MRVAVTAVAAAGALTRARQQQDRHNSHHRCFGLGTLGGQPRQRKTSESEECSSPPEYGKSRDWSFDYVVCPTNQSMRVGTDACQLP